MKLNKSLLNAAMALSLASSSAFAAISADEAARLGKDLTPVGAEKAGNADGTIPAWTGGLTKAPAGWKRGDDRPDFFAGEKPLFTIDASNMAQYADKLTDGQKALMKQYPEFKMNVYKTHRTAAWPQSVYDAIKANATKAELTEGGNAVANVWGSIPFPVPKNGNEVIWNHNMRFQGYVHDYPVITERTIQNNGQTKDWTAQRFVNHTFYDPNVDPKDKKDGILFKYSDNLLSPARDAGDGILAMENVDGFHFPRKAWTYDPGERRVRRAPNLQFDTPGRTLTVVDDYDLFSGSMVRYDWKLIGKKEIYVPYNNNKLNSTKNKMDETYPPKAINSDLVRYELHRVWVVEANVNAESRHVYAKRTFYVDEDTWTILATDKYDGNGNLWRVGFMYPVTAPEVPVTAGGFYVHYDLKVGAYYVMGGVQEQAQSQSFDSEPKPASYFTPAALRRRGR